MEDDRWYVSMWVLASVGDEEKGHKQSDMVNRDGPAEDRRGDRKGTKAR